MQQSEADQTKQIFVQYYIMGSFILNLSLKDNLKKKSFCDLSIQKHHTFIWQRKFVIHRKLDTEKVWKI